MHENLNVPEGEIIPEGKKKDALAGKYGKTAKKEAIFAFRGALKKGRETVKKNSKKK